MHYEMHFCLMHYHQTETEHTAHWIWFAMAHSRWRLGFGNGTHSGVPKEKCVVHVFCNMVDWMDLGDNVRNLFVLVDGPVGYGS